MGRWQRSSVARSGSKSHEVDGIKTRRVATVSPATAVGGRPWPPLCRIRPHGAIAQINPSARARKVAICPRVTGSPGR